MKAVLRNDRENIFIPTSGSNITLIKILPQLTLLVREQPDSRVHLFGYPEWQTYTKDHLEAFFELDTYFYSSFYTNNLLPAAITFTKSYRKWYGKEMDERYPRLFGPGPYSNRLRDPSSQQLGRLHQPESILCTFHQKL